MTVKRIVFNIATDNTEPAARFYRDVLDLDLLMDFGWIQTFGANTSVAPQLSVASEGGSGTDVPDVSIEVDNLDEVHKRCVENDFEVEYGPVDEPWGVRVSTFATRLGDSSISWLTVESAKWMESMSLTVCLCQRFELGLKRDTLSYSLCP